jgi:hypothetical protein
MSGENSKRSGEIGEALASSLLTMMGWKPLMRNVSIDCNNSSHVNDAGNPKRSHGEDQVFLYHSPFHDESTCIVHVSDKNVAKYPAATTLKTKFRAHLKELHETIDCSKYNPKIREICTSFECRKTRAHAGLLVWLHNDDQDIEKDIKGEISSIRLDQENTDLVYLIDNDRASFLLKMANNLRKRSEDFYFYYPRIGTAVTQEEARYGKYLPLELVVADIIPAFVQKGDAREFILYAKEVYSADVYKRLIAYSLAFSGGLVQNIYVGMLDYNPSQDKEETDRVRMAFHERQECISPFSFNTSIMSLIEENRDGITS